jgi:glucan biosynthesis protein C
MIAGIFFHASLSFLKEPVNLWPVFDQQSSTGLLDLFTWASHRIRMPLFFVVCGFFSYMLLEKYDLKAFIKNRTKKILIPFIASLILIVPITIETFISDGQFSPYSISRIQHFSLMHLWFLYFLIIFYTFFVIFKEIITKFSNTPSKLKDLFFVSIITILIFSMKTTASINTSPDFIPDIIALSFYFTFYLLGIYFYKSPNLFRNYYNKKTYFFLIFSFIVCPIILLLKLKNFESVLNISTSIFTLSSLIIVIELSKRIFNNNSKTIRYISDSSYWLYLIHIPIIVSVQTQLIAIALPKEIKFLITSIATLLITLTSYQLIVRYSIIGTYLHGKRNKNEIH